MSKSEHPPFKFTKHPSISSLAVTSQTYLSDHPDCKFKYIATGAIVYDNPESKYPRILLIQRSALDSWPNRWEIPGGACDDDDESILHGVARELWEESGLVAAKIGPVVGDAHQFVSSSGRHVGKFIFVVEVDRSAEGGILEVKLCSTEHQRFVWAKEDEVRAMKVGGIKLEFTSADLEATVLGAFKLRRNGE